MNKCANTTQYFYQGNQLRLKLQGGGFRAVFRASNHPTAQVQGQGNQVYAHLLTADLQGSVIQVLTGQDEHTPFSYTAFGHDRVENGELSLLGYAGERRDLLTAGYALGNGYRTYSPMLMRFHSSDHMSPFGKGGINAYGYCAGDPVNNSDPTGHMRFSLRRSFAPAYPRLGRVNRSSVMSSGSLEDLSSPPRSTRGLSMRRNEVAGRGHDLPISMRSDPNASVNPEFPTPSYSHIQGGSSAVSPPNPSLPVRSEVTPEVRSELTRLLINSQMDRDVEWYLRANHPDTRQGMSADFLNLPEANDLVRRVNERRVRQLKVLDRR